MQFDAIDSLKAAGFEGFVTVATLWEKGCKQIPSTKGVYVIVRNLDNSHEIRDKSRGGWFKDKDPTISKAILETRWIDEAIVLYIGQAGGIKGDKVTEATLQKRLETYMKFGRGVKAAHRGGKAIWQLENASDLLVCWRAELNEDPRHVETQLIQEFKQQHNRKCPFANRAKCRDKKIPNSTRKM